MGGDFNAVWYPSEKLGASRLTNQLGQFNEFIEDHGLVDLPLKGATFTWTNNQEIRVSSHLDKFLFLVDWMDKGPMIFQGALHKLGSDHIPILLWIEQIPSGSCPFRFELMWLEIPRFNEKLKSW